MLLNHNYAIETFLNELYHLHTFYSFKCSLIFTTDKIPKHSKMYISYCLIIIMLLKHSWKNYTSYTPFIPLNVQVIFTTDSSVTSSPCKGGISSSSSHGYIFCIIKFIRPLDEFPSLYSGCGITSHYGIKSRYKNKIV